MDRDPNSSPFLEVPAVVVALAVVIGGLEIIFWAGSAGYLGGPEAVGWRLGAMRDWAVIDSVFSWMLSNATYPPEQVARLVTYPLLHTSFVHAAFVVVFVLAIGKAISGVFSAWKFLLVFWVASVAGAFAFLMFLDSAQPLVGGYPGVYGLIGCFTFLLWIQARIQGEAPLNAFRLIGFLLGIQLIFGALFGSGGEWVADIAGFAAGFLLSFILVPGGWAHLLARLRNR